MVLFVVIVLRTERAAAVDCLVLPAGKPMDRPVVA
jgi:hypothetical protein